MIPWTDVTAWTAAFVALWWVADWLNMRQEGETLPLRRDPLGVLAAALRKLARNRSLLLALVALWLLGAAIGALRLYVYRLHLGAPAGPTHPAFAGLGPLADAIPRLLARALPESLPRLEPVPLSSIGEALAALLLVIAIVRLNLDPPAEIGAATVRRLRWPAAALAAFVAVYAVLLAAGQSLSERFRYDGMVPPARSVIFDVFTLVLWPALLAPLVALLWRMVLEVVDAGAWSFRSALEAMRRTWLPVALALIIANALRPVAVFLTPGGYGSAAGIAYLLVGVLLALAPWAMVDRHEGFVAALRTSWRLFRSRWFEVITFALRFTLLFAVLGALVTLLEPTGAGQFVAWYRPLAQVLRAFVTLLQVMTVAGLYVTLRDDYAEESACAGCPAAGLQP